MKRSPVWVGGGVTFGPTGKENYVLGQNKKQYRLAFRSALSEKFLEKKLAIVEDLAFNNGKTKEALTMLKALKLTGKVLLVGETLNDQVALAVRNLPKVMYVSRQQLSAVDIMNADVLVIAKPAVSKIEEVLQ